MPGVFERVIENWLTSANERSYHIPFCQLLAAEGETVIYVSPHGPFEQGKDVITLDKKGKPRGYQLKAGDIGLAEWRKHKGEINDLVEMPINHPALIPSRQHISFLVTNGEIKDTAIKAVMASNEAWLQRKYPPLRTIARGELLKRFLAAHGSYLPQEVSEFKLFMELVVRDGREPLDKEQLSVFIESILPWKSVRKPHGRELKRALASALLLIGYILEPAYRVDNHWAVFEGWIIAAAYVLALASKMDMPEIDWSGQFRLCELAALDALSSLCSECETRDHFLEGDAFTDGQFYGVRMTIIAGLASALALHARIGRTELEHMEFIRKFAAECVPKMKIWGESAIPYFVLVALFLESNGQQILGESHLIAAMRAILETNSRRDHNTGLPSTYYSAEQAIRLLTNLGDPGVTEDFEGGTYTVQPLIDFLTRRWRRQALREVWYLVTANTMRSFYPSTSSEWFRWRSEEGSLDSRIAGSPQSWAALIRDVEAIDVTVLPPLLRERPSFAIFFSLVYPHRFTRELLKLIESAIVSL